MSYKTLIEQQVANAFTIIGDMKKPLVFTNTSERDYDFTTGEVSETNATIASEGVVEFITVNEDNDVNSILDSLRLKFIVNRADFPNGISQFDSFTADGSTYKIVNFTDNGYSIEGLGVGE